MEIEVLDKEGNRQKSIKVSSANFDAEFNSALVHQVVVAYRAAYRAGTHAQKNRSRVRGGGAKPFRQKGTGRARAGTRNSPINRGGGQTFAASPRDYSQKVNRKAFRAAMRSTLSETLRRDNLIVVTDLDCDAPSTKQAVQQLKNLNCQKVLIVDDNASDNLHLSLRNIPNVHLIDPSMLNPADVVDQGKVLMTESAVKSVDEWLQ